MSWEQAITNAVLVVAIVATLFVSGTGALFAFEVKVQRFYGVLFIVTFTSLLAWVLRIA